MNAGRTVVVVIPGNPAAVLSPNSRSHWRARQGPKKQLMRDAFYATTATFFDWDPDVDPLPEVVYEVRTVVAWGKGRRIMDGDNLLASLKPAIDGVAQALGINDKWFRFAPIQQGRDKAGKGFVEMTITELPVGAAGEERRRG